MKKIIDWIDKQEKKIETGMFIACGIALAYWLIWAIIGRL